MTAVPPVVRVLALLLVASALAAVPVVGATSDDFNACDLDAGVWTFVDPMGDSSYSFDGVGTDNARLKINVPAGQSHDPWNINAAPRVMQNVPNTDFQVIVKMESAIGQRYQTQGLMVEQDSGVWLRFDFVADTTVVRAFAARTANGVSVSTIDQIIGPPPTAVPLWLRVTRTGNTWKHEHSTNGTSWTLNGSFSYPMTVTKIGLFGGNFGFGDDAPGFDATFDYLFDAATPISPEDGSLPGGNTLTVNVVGDGSVAKTPNQPLYYCGASVSLLATPQPGSVFLGWSGDLTGIENPKTIAVPADRVVTATFGPDTSPPAIANVQVVPHATWAEVTWTTNEPSTSRVDFDGDQCTQNCSLSLAQYVAAWGFEGSGSTVKDVTGHGHPGSLVSPATRAAGYFGDALETGGTGGHVNLGTLDVSGSELTIALWVRPDDFGVTDARLISKSTSDAEQDHTWMLSTLGDAVRFRVKTTAGGTTTLSSPAGTLTAGVWTHLAATYDGAQMVIYKDGLPIQSAAKTGTLVTAPAVEAWIGDNPGGGKSFDGRIDEVRIWSRALPQEEIGAEMDRPSYGDFGLDPALVTQHRVSITGLVPESDYHFMVTSVDASSQWASSGDFSFTTGAAVPGPFESDDFNACDLAGGPWTFVDPVGDSSWFLTGAGTSDARLHITVPAGQSHDPWAFNDSARLMQPAADQDFQVVVKLESVVGAGYQEQGIIVEQDSNHWMRFDFVASGSVVYAFAAAVTDAVPTPKVNKIVGVFPSPVPMYLRVTRTGDQWKQEYSLTGLGWTVAGTFVHPIDVHSIGPYAGNFGFGGPAPAHTAIFDYFFEAGNPLPDDAGLPGGALLDVQVTGNGAVEVDPDRPAYHCGEEAELTAVPDPGSVFTGWGGDLAGIALTRTLAIDQNRTVTASFAADTIAPLIGDISADPRDNWAVVTWATNEPATSRVEFGETAGYGQVVEDLALRTEHSLVLTGLTPETLYHFRVLSTDGEAQTATSGDQTFTTLAFVTGPAVSDDFDACELDEQLWTWINPKGDASYRFAGTGTDQATLEIEVPPNVNHDPFFANDAPRLMQNADDTDFQLETRIDTVLREGNQIAGIIVQQDATRWMRFDFYSDGTQVSAFAAISINGTASIKINKPLFQGPSPASLWLRVTRTGSLWIHEYSTDGEAWTVSGSFVQPLAVSSVGVFAGNFGPAGGAPGLIATFDYFFETSVPQVPEDGPIAGGQPVATQVTGNGSIERSPDRELYYCAEEVELRAVPDPGSEFLDWSGDVTGSDNPVTLVVDAPKSVTADFGLAPGPPFITDVEVEVRDDFAFVRWRTNEPSSSRVDFGTTVSYGSFVEDPALKTEHELLLAGLTPETEYHYRITSVDSSALPSSTADATFETTQPDFQSDDFNAYNLDASRWTFVNPFGDAYYYVTGAGTEDAKLHIHVPSTRSHDPWIENQAPRLMQPANDVDFQLAVKIESVINLPTQQQGIIVEQDADNWLRFDFVYNEAGHLAFAAHFGEGMASSKVRKKLGFAASPSPIWLRVTREGDEWTQEYSFDGQGWTTAGSFLQPLTVTAVGVFGGNYGAQTIPEHTAIFDSFENVEQPIEDEDQGPPAEDETPPVLQFLGTSSDETFFRVIWATDEPATGRVEYGLTTGYELGAVDDPGLALERTIEIPDLTPQTVYHFRFVSEDEAGNVSTSGDHQILVQGISFDVFYGANQHFGQLGVPQRWVNVTGNVFDPDGIAELYYSLNGGPDEELSLGPDGRRLAHDGDFVIEIDHADLLEGLNEVRLTATDTIGAMEEATVWVDATDGNVWPRNYSVNWSTVTDLLDVAQPVDGDWELTGTSVRIAEPGYDRILAIGDIVWTDFEVLVPITAHSIDPEGYGIGGPAFGLALRWQGHVDWDGSQPRWGHWPLGAIAWFNWTQTTNNYRLMGNEERYNLKDNATPAPQFGVPYWHKARVQTNPTTGASTYRYKYWQVGTPEPAVWKLQMTLTEEEDPGSGSLLLLAHFVDAEYGNVSITNLDCSHPGATLTETVVGGGTVTRDVDQELYVCYDPVTLTAIPDPGWEFSGWSGDLTGSANPAVVAMTENRSVTATFVPATGAPVLGNVVVVPGDTWATVTWDSNEPASSRVDHGLTAAYGTTLERPDLVTQHSVTLFGLTPDTLYHYRVSSRDSDALSSSSNDLTFTTATAVGTPFESDDFNACALDTGTWTFVDPRGDASVSLHGTGTADATVHIEVPGGLSHDAWFPNQAPRLMQPAANTDFVIETRIDSVAALQYQSQGILVQQDATNFLRFDAYSDGATIHAFVAKIVNGVPSSVLNQVIQTGPLQVPFYMRVSRVGNVWTYEYSPNRVNWFSPGSFTLSLNVSQVGLFAGNIGVGGPAPAHTGIFDYFVYEPWHSEPEDGGVPGVGRALDLEIVGDGTVERSPDYPFYYCGEEVTLTATAAPGSGFVGWSGDLAGGVNPETVTLDADRQVTATFESIVGPPVIFDVQVTVADTRATIEWSTHEPATSRVDYGLTSGYGAFEETAALVTQHSVTLTGLAPETLYHYRITSADDEAQPASTADATFTTLALIPGPFFSDDFNACTLDEGVWTFVDPVGDSSFTVAGGGSDNAHVSITVPAGVAHDAWTPNNAARLMQPAADEDFQLEVKFESAVTKRFQEQGVLVEQDAQRWLRFDFHSEGTEVHVIAVSTAGGVPTPLLHFPVALTTPQYMRVTRTGNQWLFEYSPDGIVWTPAGQFSSTLVVNSIGLLAGNAAGASGAPAHTMVADYFFDALQPVEPEDGGLAGAFETLDVDVVGGGSVLADPDQTEFYCDETVLLTAVPDTGWVFTGWSGDLTGLVNPQTLSMAASRSVTATFDPDTFPPIIDGVQVTPGATTATVTWVTNEPATSVVDYGETAAYGLTESDPTLVTNHTVVLSDLEPGTLYHYRITSTDVSSFPASTPDDTFTTSPFTGALVSDDFSAPAIDPVLWTFVDPRGDGSASVSGSGTEDARLSIAVPGGVSHDAWSVNDAPRLMQPAQNVDFQVEVKLESAISGQYKFQGVLVEQSASRWIRFDFLSDASNVYAFAATGVNGIPTVRVNQAIAATVPKYLRVSRNGNSWTFEHSANGTAWTTAGVFTSVLTVNSVGVMAGNLGSGGSAPAHTAVFDYFFDTASPIVPEDGP